MLSIPSKDPMDPSFKKLIYIRYADDWVLGVKGSYEDCISLLSQIKSFLKEELGLNLSEQKTLITNARTSKALFLGTKFGKSHHQSFNKHLGFLRRNNTGIRMVAPLDRIMKKLNEAGLVRDKKPIPRFL